MGIKKLLLVYPNQFGYHTDSFKYCCYLPKNYEITYICFDQGFKVINLQGVKVKYIEYNCGSVKRILKFLFAAIKESRDSSFDLLFVIQFKLCFLLGLFVKARIKVIDYRTGDLSRNKFIRFCKNRLIFLDSLFFNNVTVISEGLRDILRLKKGKTFILPLGGDMITGTTHSYSEIHLLYVGSFNLRNIYQTIEGVALFLAKTSVNRSEISYTIVGFGNQAEVELIRTAIIRNSLQDVVNFPGRRSIDELQQYFDNSNIGISYVPKTPYYEYQPVTKTFEYANSGLFVIATSTFENKKVINHSNGLLCDDTPEDFARALELIWETRFNIDESEIRSSLKNYTWEAIVTKLMEPYFESLLVK